MVVERDRVVSANAAALDAGVHPGMKVASAWALAADLHVCERDVPAEEAALQSLACWSGRLTPHVSLQRPDTLLLEVGGCLRLFQGIDRIIEIAVSETEELGHAAQFGIAPTPRAALWRARSGASAACDDPQRTLESIADLPVEVMDLRGNQQAAISAWGVRTVGQLYAQPKDGLASRLGKAIVVELAQALGELPDPRPFFAFLDHFVQRQEWLSPIEHTTPLLFASRRIVAALSGWLSQRASGLRQCDLVLKHPHAEDTRIALRFAEAIYQTSRIERVLRERLDRHTLVEPVIALSLEATRIEALTGEALALFGDSPPKASVAEIIERLRARVGEDCVRTLSTRADYRPEDATAYGGAPAAPPPTFPRPFWLLPAPRRLQEVKGRPCHGGPLTLKSGPERIESGWWDSDEQDGTGEVRRDYFAARGTNGQWMWIYRDSQGWWLHGLFG